MIGCLVAFVVLLAIVIPVALVVSKKNNSDSDSGSGSSSSGSGGPSNSNLDSISRDSIPVSLYGILFMIVANPTSELCKRYCSRSVYLVRHKRLQCHLHERHSG